MRCYDIALIHFCSTTVLFSLGLMAEAGDHRCRPRHLGIDAKWDLSALFSYNSLRWPRFMFLEVIQVMRNLRLNSFPRGSSSGNLVKITRQCCTTTTL